jgi:hypothetical protein
MAYLKVISQHSLKRLEKTMNIYSQPVTCHSFNLVPLHTSTECYHYFRLADTLENMKEKTTNRKTK